jgi:hypothetical protein
LDRVRHWTEDIGLAMWLARPGAARRIGSDVHVENTYGTARGGNHLGVFPHTDQAPVAWPRLRELPLATVWRWLRASRSVDSNFAEDSVGRAVHAVGHILYTSNFVTELVWVMVGLESLFTTGEGGLLHQVRATIYLTHLQEGV